MTAFHLHKTLRMPQFTLRVDNFVVRVEAVSTAGARHIAERHCYAETLRKLSDNPKRITLNTIHTSPQFTYPGIGVIRRRSLAWKRKQKNAIEINGSRPADGPDGCVLMLLLTSEGGVRYSHGPKLDCFEQVLATPDLKTRHTRTHTQP